MLTSVSALHATLQPQNAARYEHMQMHNARTFVLDLLRDPAEFLNHAKRYAARKRPSFQ